jgi:pimeloyl-ACP methyl ester carboxylesterase
MTLAQFVAHTRAELAKSGMERAQFEQTVYWRSAAVPAAGEAASRRPVLVLLHGASDQAGTWFAVAGKLAKTHRVLAPDLAGHGESGPKEGPLPLPMMVVQLDALLDHEHVKRATLVGNSMGGWVAMLYAMEHPDRVERLVLEDASGMLWPLSVPLVAANRDDAVKILRAVHGPDAPTPEWAIEGLLDSHAGDLMKRVMAGGVLDHLVDLKLSSLKTPATLIWGKDDGLLPVAYAEALQKKIAGSTLIVIDGAAHMPHRQQPEKFLECLSKSSSPSARE